MATRIKPAPEWLYEQDFYAWSKAQAELLRGGWYDTILTQRGDLLAELTPSIRREIAARLPDLYDRARQNAATSLRKHGEDAAADALPETCPYSFEQIIGDWLP